jgi:hypothetical protein
MIPKTGSTMTALLFLAQALSYSLYAQFPSQVVRGMVVDWTTGVALPGATIQLTSPNFSKGVVSNAKGIFRIPDIPVGRYSIEVRFIGYEPFGVAEVLVTSARPVILEFRLQESVSEIESVEIKARVRKDIPLNQMATLSARTFTVEETRRYAGGFDDPGRMAASFAGVAGGTLTTMPCLSAEMLPRDLHG